MIIKNGNDYVYIPAMSDIVSPSLSLEENKAGTLKFTILPTHPLYNNIAKLNNGIKVLDDSGSVLWKGRAITSEIDFYGQNEIQCEGKLACLNDSLYRPYEYSGTVEGLLSAILTNHNSQVNADQQILLGTVSDDLDLNDYIVRKWEKHTSSWELVKTRLLDLLGGHLVMRYESNGDYLDYLSDTDMTTVSSQTIRFGENLTDISQLIDATATYTACIPLGAEIIEYTYGLVEYTTENPPTWQENKYYQFVGGAYVLVDDEQDFNAIVAVGGDLYTITSQTNTGQRVDIKSINTQRKASGLDYLLATSQMVSAYGKIYAPISDTTWDDVTEPLNLYNKAVDYIDNQAVLLSNEVDISFADLSKLGVVVDDIRLYDKVQVISSYHGVNAQYLVRKVTYSLDAPETSAITIGDNSLTLTDKTASMKSGESASGEGTQGPAGKSAYESAVEGGYTGTEAQFNTDLADVPNKAGLNYVDTRFTTIDTEVSTVEDTLSTRITEVSGNVSQVSTRTTAVEQRADSIEIHAQAIDTTLAEHGQTVENINANFTFSTDGLDIGREGSTSTMHLDEDSLEFKVNNATVASFTQSAVSVRNVETNNEVGYYSQWATRKGAYISGVGNNLNDMWIGG